MKVAQCTRLQYFLIVYAQEVKTVFEFEDPLKTLRFLFFVDTKLRTFVTSHSFTSFKKFSIGLFKRPLNNLLFSSFCAVLRCAAAISPNCNYQGCFKITTLRESICKCNCKRLEPGVVVSMKCTRCYVIAVFHSSHLTREKYMSELLSPEYLTQTLPYHDRH